MTRKMKKKKLLSRVCVNSKMLLCMFLENKTFDVYEFVHLERKTGAN